MEQPPLHFVTTTDDVRIAYTALGSGPPLMLVGGVGDTAELWVDHGYVAALSPHFHVWDSYWNVDLRRGRVWRSATERRRRSRGDESGHRQPR